VSSALRLNLSRSPFVNRRPVNRLAIALWVVGGLLLVVSLVLIWSHRAGSVEGRAELARVRAESAREVELARRLRDELASLELAEQNAHVDFLNQRIAQRAFPWSRLFEQLIEVLPSGVRLRSLFPGLGAEQSRRGRSRATVLDSRVRLSISAQAEDGEAMLEFIDRLFAHPAFDQPNLMRESREGSSIGFQLDVLYQPDLEGAATEPAAEERAEQDEQDPAATPAATASAARPLPAESRGARAAQTSGAGGSP
jgi:Tfp pilus assembly protein PilN